MPLGRLLIGMGNLEDSLLGEWFPDNLHTYRQVVGKTGWYRDGRQAGNVYR